MELDRQDPDAREPVGRDEPVDERSQFGELGARRIWRGEGWYWDLKPDFKPGEIVTL